MKITIAILGVLLLASNSFWFYQLLDTSTTLSYRDQQSYELEETGKQLMAILPEIAQNSTKSEVIAFASKYTDQKVFEKEGCTWVGWLGFKFNKENRLESVSPSWSYGESDPCYK